MITVCNHKNEQYWTNHQKGTLKKSVGWDIYI